jgi:fibronectin type 3 domain-containing protein
MSLPLLIATSITLAWDASPPPIDNYTLYVGILPITEGNLPLEAYDTTDTFYTVSGLDFGTRYYFTVTASFQGLESDFSNEVTVLPMPLPTPLPTPSPTPEPTITPSPTPIPSPTPVHRGRWWRKP